MANPVHTEIPHFFEILKIIDGALNSDRNKIIAYVQQLAQKLDADGNVIAADKLRKSLMLAKAPTLSPSNIGTVPRLPIDNESRLNLADETTYAKDSLNVSVDKHIYEQIDSFVTCVKSVEKLAAHGVEITPSLLLYGPPGCGKTELAKFIASELQLPILTARIDSLMSSYLGNTAKNLRNLFDHANSRPCILFLDELDALGKIRDDQHELGELKRVVVSLLQNIDNLDSTTIILGATNHEHLLDPALWRRFAFKLKIELPDLVCRQKLFTNFLGKFAGEKELATFAVLAEGLSGADIKQISGDAKRHAVIQNCELISKQDVINKLLQIRQPQLLSHDISLSKRLELARSVAPDVITYRMLADLYGISLGYVHKLIKQEEVSND